MAFFGGFFLFLGFWISSRRESRFSSSTNKINQKEVKRSQKRRSEWPSKKERNQRKKKSERNICEKATDDPWYPSYRHCWMDICNLLFLRLFKGLKAANLNLLRRLYLAWEVLKTSNEHQKLSNWHCQQPPSPIYNIDQINKIMSSDQYIFWWPWTPKIWTN